MLVMRYAGVGALAALMASMSPCAAAPYRTEIIAQLKGQRLAGAEACFFRAGEGPEPLESFLGTREVRCLPADKVLELPPGRWWFYVQHPDRDLISATPAGINIPAPGPPADLYKRIEVELRPAATIDLTKVSPPLGPDERLAVYISNEHTEDLPMLLPIARAESKTIVPAGMRVVLLQLRNSLVVNMSDPMSLQNGERRVAPPFRPLATDRSNVIAWVEFPPEERQPAEYWRLLPAPRITLESGGKALTPAIAPRTGFGIDGGLLFFRDVPFADYTLRLRSPFWAAGDLPVEAKNAGIIIPRQGLITRPGASLTMEWSVDGPPPETPHGDCAPAAETPAHAPPKGAAARLFACDGLQPGMTPGQVDHDRCKSVASPDTIDIHGRRAAFEGVRAGTYLVSVYEPGYPLGYTVTTVSIGQETHSAISFDAFRVLGKVTMDGQPVKARLEFRKGMAVTDDEGRFYAGLPAPPKHFAISVIRCSDGELLTVHKPLQPLETNVAHDIEIHTNEVHVTVVDADTHAGVPKASVDVYSVADDGEWDLLFAEGSTDGNGITTYRNAPTDQSATVCASAPHYKQTCSDPFTVAAGREQRVRIDLPPTHHTGRIVTTHQFLFALLFFVGPDRLIRERGSVKPDGTFDYRLDHASPEYVVVVSDLPLFVQALPDAPPEELDIPIPNLPVRSFDVSISPTSGKKDAWIGLFVAGRYIPIGAFSMHQGSRGLQTMVLGGGPLRVPDIFAAGPIQVGLVSREDLKPDEEPEAHFRPPFAASPGLVLKVVEASNHVVF